MKIQILFIIVLFQICCSIKLFSQESNISIPIINYEIPNKDDSTVINLINIWRNFPVSTMSNLSSLNVVNNETVLSILMNIYDSLLVFNATKNQILYVPLPNAKITEHIYFHNYDSIFIFLDRTVVYKYLSKKQKIADFYMINSHGEIKNLYSLDSVPYIYKGSNDTMIFVRKFSLEDTKIKNNIFYIPFSLFKPDLSDTSLFSLGIRLLCAVDLNNKKIKMYNIQMPSKDIGKKYSKYTINNGFDYIFFDDTTIIYSYDYSTDIYKLNLNNDSSTLIKSFPEFPFDNEANKIDDNYYSIIGKLKYSTIEHKYIREISIKNYENFKDFNLTQILDNNFNLIGYFIQDSLFCCLDLNSNGNLIVLNKKENYQGYVVKKDIIKDVNINDFKKNYLQSNPVEEQSIFFYNDSSLTENQVLDLYVTKFNIPKNSKIVIFKFDNCGSILDYLLKKMQESNLRNPIYFIVYGEDCGSIKAIFESMKISDNDYIKLDCTNIYKGYINNENRNKVLLVKNNKNKFITVKSNHSTLDQEIKNF